MEDETPEQQRDRERRALGIIRHGIKMNEVVADMDAKELIWRWYMTPEATAIKMFSMAETLMEELARRLWPEWTGMPDGPQLKSWGWITAEGMIVYDDAGFAIWKAGDGKNINNLEDVNREVEREVEKFFEEEGEP